VRARDAAVGGDQAPGLAARAVLLLGQQHVTAPEPRLLPADRPADPGLHRRDLRRQLLAVQRVAHLGTQRVAGGQAAGAGLDGGAEQRVPDRHRVGRRYDQLVAVLAGVSRPAHRQLDAMEGGGLEAHVLVLGRQAQRGQQFGAARSLHRQYGVIAVLVDDRDTLRRPSREQRHDGGGVGGVGDQEHVIVAVQVRDDVVDHTAGRVVAAERVLSLAGLDPVEIVGEARIDVRRRAGSGDPGLAEVRDIEDPHRFADRCVFLQYAAAGVLQGHLPATERRKLGTERGVALVQRGPQQGLVSGAGHVRHGDELTR